MLRSDLHDYSDAYIAAKWEITVKGNDNANRRNKKLTLRKINNTFIDNAEDPGIVMPMYNLLEYSDNYSMTSGS